MSRPPAYRVMELDARLLPAADELFRSSKPSSRCWCAYWQVGPAYRQLDHAANRKCFMDQASGGPARGLLAFDRDVPIGWCRITPLNEGGAWLREQWPDAADRRTGTWAVSCLYVRPGHRRRGVTELLIEAALSVARQGEANAVEAIPRDPGKVKSASFTGYASTFLRCGFATVGGADSRPLMRYEIQRRTAADG